ncbi:hypothetical protein CFK39_03740 [Brachybacterium avium]|uniref:Uncharacterized protein n=1 Tax=Brachybacterium avium TaxID=2017485 RepID=A0A220UAZ3_9MICO|nr:hypothetical protein [Brachybacterium avium]ASK65086.1 hypothetical protein CFK39_03740 [Brachybacterium avium]
MMSLRVLQIGMDPNIIDFSPWPGQDAATLRTRIVAGEDALRGTGLEVVTCPLSGDADAAESAVAAHLADRGFDVIEIGAGLRTSHEYTLVFERVINTVAALQPGVPVCFNDSPRRRWTPSAVVSDGTERKPRRVAGERTCPRRSGVRAHASST